MKDRYLNTREAAEYIGNAVQTLANWRTLRAKYGKGVGPDYIKHGHQIKYKVSDIDKYMEAHRIQSPGDDKSGG